MKRVRANFGPVIRSASDKRLFKAGGQLSLPVVLFLLSIILIFSMGILMVFDTSAAEILDRDLNSSIYQSVTRHLLYAVLGLSVASIAYAIGCRALLQLSPLLLWGTIVLLVLVLVPGVGKVRNGAARWIGLGPLTLQPSELAKIAVPLYAVRLWGEKRWKPLVVGGVSLALPLVLVFLEPDKGTTVILALLVAVALFCLGVRLRYWLLPGLVVALIAGGFAMQSTYIRQRVAVYLNPESDLLGRGHQPYQAKIAAGSGGLWGKGLGASVQKLSYLPEAQNDYIAAIFAEEFGFVGIISLIFLYMLLTASGISIALRAASKEGAVVAVLFTFLIAVQAFFNLGVVSGLMPTTGLNLPFFSQGGTSLVANMLSIGIILSVQREKREYVQKKTDFDCCRWDGRSPTPGASFS